jgi:hypothetical protein
LEEFVNVLSFGGTDVAHYFATLEAYIPTAVYLDRTDLGSYWLEMHFFD